MTDPPRNPRPAGAAAARRGGVPAHGHPAVRRPRQVDPRAGPGDGSRQAHPAGRAEVRRDRRSRRRRPVRDRHAGARAATAEAARRHHQGAGRRRVARARRPRARARRRAGRPAAWWSSPRIARGARNRGDRALADGAVRAVRQDQPQAAAGTAADAVAASTSPAAWPTPSPRTWACAWPTSSGCWKRIDIGARLELLVGFVDGEIDVQQLEKRIRGRVKSQMEKSQREYYLNEQMKAIQKELGEIDEAPNDIDELARKIAEAGMPKPVEAKAKAELNKLKQMSPMSAEAAVVRNYLDWLLGVPWKKRSKVRKDLKAAQDVLDADHLRPGEGQGTHPRIPRRADAREEDEGRDPVPGRPAGRGQDLARPVDRQGHQPQVRAHVAGRRARRGRDPRPSPHLCRFDAGPHRAEPQQGRHARIRCSCSTRSTRCRWTSAAIRRRRCWKCSIRSRTTRSTTTTSKSTST